MSKTTLARLEKLERAGSDQSTRFLAAHDKVEAERLRKLHPSATIIVTGVARCAARR